MNKLIKTATVLSFAVITALSSCKKKEDPVIIVDPPNPSGSVHMEFFNKVGGDMLILNTGQYQNQNGDTFNVTKFNYFITNIKLNKADGTQFTETESYHLLKQSNPSSMTFDIAEVPNGTYKSVTFMIGVDSLRNSSGAQTGALDVNNDMYWDWNSGYIMMKMEGSSSSSTQGGGLLQFHMGGFSGANSVLRTVTLTFPQDLVINGNEQHMHVTANLLKMFGDINIIDFATLSAVHMPGANAKKIADNYQQMFSVTAIGE